MRLLCIFTFSYINLFFLNYLFSEYSHLEKQCESTCQIWKDKWIRFSINPLLSFFIKWKGQSFPRCTEVLGTSIFFCAFGLLSTSLFPSHKLFQWNNFTAVEYVILWRRKLWRTEFKRGWWSDNLGESIPFYSLFFWSGEWLAPWNGYFQAHLFL